MSQVRKLSQTYLSCNFPSAWKQPIVFKSENPLTHPPSIALFLSLLALQILQKNGSWTTDLFFKVAYIDILKPVKAGFRTGQVLLLQQLIKDFSH